MSEFKEETRHKSASTQSHGRRRFSRQPATAKPASALSRFAATPSLGQRAAVVTTACAVLIGLGAVGQASESTAPSAATESSPATADAQPKLDYEKIHVSAQPAPTEAAVAPQSAAIPAPAPAPDPAPAPEPVAAAAVNDPAGAQAYAAGQLGSYGWAADQMQCLQTLWTKESNWTTTATNASSGAYGIVQSLPAEKMASTGADYLTNYRTQINWGLDYVKERYGSPCGALNFHYANNWY